MDSMTFEDSDSAQGSAKPPQPERRNPYAAQSATYQGGWGQPQEQQGPTYDRRQAHLWQPGPMDEQPSAPTKTKKSVGLMTQPI